MEEAQTELKKAPVSIIRKAASRIGHEEIPHKKIEVLSWVTTLDPDEAVELNEETQSMVAAKKESRKRGTRPISPLTRGNWSTLLPGDAGRLVHEPSGTSWECAVHDQPAQGQLVVKLGDKLILMMRRGDDFCCARNREIKLITLDRTEET